MSTAELLLDSGDIVGESITWDERREALFWVDIVGSRLNRFVLASGEHRVLPMDERPTSIGLCADGRLIVGLTKRVVFWDGEQEFSALAEVEPELPDNRLNEGQVAPDGSYWVGTMENNIFPDNSPKPIEGAKGRLYRVSPEGAVSRLSDDVFAITNTMCWLEDGRFVTADTMENALFVYDVAGDRLVNRRPFTPPIERGLPDGSTMDADGFVWNCRVVGGAALARIAPDGRVDRVVELPCSSPTSCTFGGPDLDRLFVTSSCFGMSAEERDARPHEGSVFVLDGLGVKGRPARRFGRG
jgi:sugar lactone lactonase YvrE